MLRFFVRDIKVDGLERVEPETVLSYVEVKKGSVVKQTNWTRP
jgi:outer membrane protein assembly factor BamA